MATASLLGQSLANRYRILRGLAEGSTGAVYLADDLASRARVVVKVLVPELSFDSRTLPHLRQRLQRRSTQPPAPGSARSHIVDITDVGILSNDDLYVVMPYLQGDHLAGLLRRRTILRWSQARTLVVTVGRLIAEYHREMLLEGSWPVLGTLQSSNCYCLRGQPKEASIKLVNSAVDDLIVRRQWRETGDHVASLARYGAPELSTGERLDVRADVYGFGVIVYELLTAQVPFADSNAARLEAMHLMSQVPAPRAVAPAAKIPEALEEVLLKALAKRTEDRYPTMTAFIDALQAVKATVRPAVRRGGGPRRPPRRRSDTLIMASPDFEELDRVVGEALVADDPPGYDGADDDGVDELAAAMGASAEDEVSGELGGENGGELGGENGGEKSGEDGGEDGSEDPEGDRGEPERAAPARGSSTLQRPPAAVVEGKPEIVEDGHADAASGRRRSKSKTAPHAISEDTQVRARPRLPPRPRAGVDASAHAVAQAGAENQPPLLIRRSSVPSEGSTVRLGGEAATRARAAEEAAGESSAGQSSPGSADAATVRLPVVDDASIERSGAGSAVAAAAATGFGEAEPAGGGFGLWLLVAVVVAVTAFFVSGGLGFIAPKGDALPENVERAAPAVAPAPG